MSCVVSVLKPTSGSQQTTDHHSGFYFIPASQQTVVENTKQMTTWGPLLLDGVLIVEGQHFVEN